MWTRTLGKNQQNTGSDKYIFLKKMKKSAFYQNTTNAAWSSEMCE